MRRWRCLRLQAPGFVAAEVTRLCSISDFGFRISGLEGRASSRRLPPGFMNSKASQSSSSGCVGGEPCVPKSFAGSTIPRAKYCCQMRLTMTRAVSGLCGSTIQRARSRRFGSGDGESGRETDFFNKELEVGSPSPRPSPPGRGRGNCGLLDESERVVAGAASDSRETEEGFSLSWGGGAGGGRLLALTPFKIS